MKLLKYLADIDVFSIKISALIAGPIKNSGKTSITYQPSKENNMTLTPDDLKAIGQAIDSKLDDRFEGLEESIDQKFDQIIDEFQTSVRSIVKEELDQFKQENFNRYDKMITKLDKAIGQLQDSRNTQEIHGQAHQDTTDSLDKHEVRITSLESAVIANA
jgi:hypothetical protein